MPKESNNRYALFSPRDTEISEPKLSPEGEEFKHLLERAGFAPPLQPLILDNPGFRKEKDFKAAIDFIRNMSAYENPLSSPEPLSPGEKRKKIMHENNLAELYAKYRIIHNKNKIEADNCCVCS